MLDVDTVVDQGQVVSQYRAGGCGQFEFALLDERHDGHRGYALGAARDAETRVEPVRDAMAAVREAVGAGERSTSGAVDADNAREMCRRGDLVDRLRQAVHGRSLGAPASNADGERCAVAGQRGTHAVSTRPLSSVRRPASDRAGGRRRTQILSARPIYLEGDVSEEHSALLLFVQATAGVAARRTIAYAL
jgi:hypothetical protein